MSEQQNFILASLNDDERARLLTTGRRFALRFAETLLRPEQLVEQVYFPETGVISIITETGGGEVAEGGVTGSEGAAGLPEALGSGVMRSRGVVQASGMAWIIPAADCRGLFVANDRFRAAAAKVAEFQAVEARQSLLCRSHHAVEQRLARWLLEMAERTNTQSRSLQITQEILGYMLAVQRTTVSSIANQFRRDGLIAYLRGVVVLKNIDGLEKTACACRGAVREAEADILGRRRVWPAQFA